MGDPVERMRKFVEGKQQQARLETSRTAWSQRVIELVPRVDAVVGVVRSALAPEQFSGPAVSVLVDAKRELYPLVVAFGSRLSIQEGTLKLHPEPLRTEAGASAVFRCEPDGNVYGFRYPFHGRMKSLSAERFLELGEPATVQADDLGNAVAEFLEWATTGGGCGGHPLHFGPPATIPFVGPLPRLSVIAA